MSVFRGAPLALLLVACGGAQSALPSPSLDASTSNATGDDGGAGVSPSDASFPSVVHDGGLFVHDEPNPAPLIDPQTGVDLPGTCPAQAPMPGAGCAVENAVCSYGDDVDARCRTWTICQQGTWQAGPPGTNAGCGAFEPVCQGSSPSELPVCPPAAGVACHFDSGTMCTCYGEQWWCADPTPGCAAQAPNVGTACTGDARCLYGTSAYCYVVGCINGAWNGQVCPQPLL